MLEKICPFYPVIRCYLRKLDMRLEQRFLIIHAAIFDLRPAADQNLRAPQEVVDLKRNVVFMLMIFGVRAKGHGDERGAAPGDGAPGVPDHGRDLHRAREEGQTREHGPEAGTLGSGRRLSGVNKRRFSLIIETLLWGTGPVNHIWLRCFPKTTRRKVTVPTHQAAFLLLKQVSRVESATDTFPCLPVEGRTLDFFCPFLICGSNPHMRSLL